MSTESRASNPVFVWQNLLAALVFVTLVSGDCLAYFLDRFPTSETLWWASISMHRLSSTFSSFLGDMTGGTPAAPFLLLVLATLVPLWAYLYRNLIATAASGHLALGGCVVMLSNTLDSTLKSRLLADTSLILDARLLSMSNITIFLAALLMLILCGLNHMMYFRRLSA